jgi:hypothetical protein
MSQLTEKIQMCLKCNVRKCGKYFASQLFPPLMTLYCLLEKLQMRTFKRYLSNAILLTTLHLREMN